jgi:hypothetical protein
MNETAPTSSIDGNLNFYFLYDGERNNIWLKFYGKNSICWKQQVIILITRFFKKLQ